MDLSSYILGIISTIIAFYLTKIIENKIKKKNNLKYLKREFEFNIDIIERFIKHCEKILKAIEVGDEIHEYFALYKFQKTAFNNCLNYGYLYDKFENKDISILNGVISFFSEDNEKSINKIIRWINEKYNVDFAKEAVNKFKEELENKKGALLKLKNKL